MNRFSTLRWIRSTHVLVAAVSLGLAGSVVAAPVVDGSALDIADVRWGSSYELGATSNSQPSARALSLASADVDADGYPELFSGYALDGGGLISVNRGNREAWAPSTPQSRAMLKSGQFPSGFLKDASAVKVPVAPELMATGDFDHDGHADLVVAQRGDSAIYLMRGTDAGLAAPQKLAQSGGVDALAAGAIDRPDGFADLAVAVSSKSGASLQIYAAGIDAKARTHTLPAAAAELHFGQIDASPMGDLAVLSAGKVLLLHGVDRSTRSAPGDTLESLDFDFPVQAMALGNFIWDRDGNTELALLKDDGSIQIAARGTLKTTPFTVDEIRAKRRAQIAAKSSSIKSWQPGSDAGWRVAESLPGLMSKASTGAAPRLMRAQLTNESADDLLAVDTLGRTINLLTFDGAKRSRSQLPTSLAPAAVLALQTSALPRSGLIVLGGGSAPATVLPAAPTATFTVTKTADTNDGTCNADCSLREAIGAANTNGLGADIVVIPAGTYTLTIANAGGVNEDNNATGDLDVIGATALVGAGAATTIIQAGTTNANGIDKVLAFSPACFSAITSSLSDVTVRFGRNTQPSTDPLFSYTGGGIDVCNTGAGGFTMTNVVVDQNTNVNGYGGGVNFDSLAPANGTYSISNSTISGNRTTSAASVLKNGGGINLFADQHAVNITNTTISGNTSAAEGGGVFVRHTNGGAITISGSTIANNTAASRGGGVSNINLGASTLTINNDSVISGNISQGTALSTESRGGGVFVASAGSTTIREVSITGNQASTGTGQLGGGIAAISGSITAQFNRISGNSASSGSGFHNAGATVTGTRNWWGCNAGPGAAPCDRSINTSGTLGTTPHLILRHVASPSTIFVTQTSTLTADFLRDSGGGVIAVADLDALIGTSKVFNGAVLGGLSAAQTSIQANGTATATFTATGAGAGGANSVVDAHTETAAITINRFNSTTLITGDLPDPSIVGAAVPVNFTVTPVAPGVIAPTGNVVVTVSGGAETCTGTVAAGTCSITLTVGGSRTLTATYSGDTLYNPSSDTEPHTVVVCPSTVVTNGNDAGAGSLRQIIADACVGSTVTFQAGVSTVTLTSAELSINKDLTIDGGASLVTVTRSNAGGTPNFRIFNVQSGNTVSMNALTVSNGNHPSQAGGIQNSGSLTLTNMHITGNRSSQSGGLQNDSVLNLSNSSVTNNVATSFAGGMAIAGAGTTTLANCTFTGNQGGSDSGAIGAGGTSLTITNCTIAGNTLVNAGGLGAGITINTVPTTIRNTILFGNTESGGSQRNIEGNLQAASAFNVLGTGPAGGLINGTNNNQVGVSAALLGSLANYGGLTPTLPLLPGSVAINTGTSISAPANDQRGIARVGVTDIGAFESRGFNMALTGGDAQTAVISTAFANPLVATVTAIAPVEPVQGGRVTFTPPGAGASAAIATSPATINGSGVASVNATANATVGSYAVTASSTGSTGVSFALQNRLASANLSITKTDGVTTAVPGASVTYTITAGNAGPDPSNATVADTFPAIQTCTWTCAAAGGASCAANGAGNINDAVFLPVSGSVVYTAICNIAASATGSMTNTATVSGPLNDSNPANNSATDIDTLAPAADLGITKTDGVVSVFAGGNTTYTITTSNAGPSNATGATVSDTFPATLTCTWTCVGAGGGTCTAAGAGNISDTVNLPAGGSVTHTASCSISAAASGSLVNTATVTAPGGVTDGNGANNSATDTDTISALPTLSINDVSVAEGNAGTGTLTFTVTRTGAAAGAVGFDFATSDGSATTGNNDYVAAGGTGSIASGGATGTTTINVTINGDGFFENNENFNVTLSAPTGAVIADGTGVGTINNDDTAPTLAINDVSIIEGNSGTQNLVFTVTRTGLTNLPADFSAVTANGTATAPSDYLAALAGSTSIAAGGPTGTTTLTATINGDFVVEANETFVVNLSAPSNATIADNQGTGTITNDDTAGIVLVQSSGSTDVTEGGATDNYTLVLTSQPTSNVSVALNPDAQVTAVTSPVVFTTANWATPQVVTVTAVDDVIVEGAHTGTITHAVTSADATYNGFTVANVVANITDNDLPTLAINDVSITEGNSGTQNLTFTVTRTGTSASAVGFTFATADDTATTADGDYLVAGGTGTIPGGGASGTTAVNVTINGDATFENTESFFVNLTAPTNASISDAQGIGTITNDDTAPTLAINDVSIIEGNAGTQNLVFTVTRTGPTALPASFSAATADGTASAPSDYLAALTGSTSIAAGGATGTTTLTATINGDAVVEANETFVVNLSAPSNATIADNQATGTITNDDTAGVVLVQSGGSTDVTEGSVTDSYTLVLTSQPTANVSVALSPDAQVTAATSPVVFTTVNWATPQVVTVTAVDDAAIEGPHTGTITHAVTSADAIYNAFPVANVVANITDNDLPTLAINDVSIAEGNSGTQTLTFTVTRTGPSASAVGFTFATANDTATTADSDYVAAGGTGTIPGGGASGSTTISVTINGDATFENNESFFVNLTAPTNATITDAQGVGTITNDDTAPTLAINDVSIVEGNTGTQNLVFTVTRTGLTALPASFTAATAEFIATTPSDYLAALVGSTTIAAGGATGTTTLSATINGDFIVEPNETFFVNLSAPANATISDDQGLGTINNDDTAGISVVQSGGTTNVTEGGATDTYTVVLTSQPTADVSIALNGGTQVTPSPTPLVFTSGNWNLPQTVTVTAVDDPVIEGNHSGAITSAVTSVNGIYNGFVVAPVSVAITDNDTPGVTLVESGGNTLVTEGGATDTYTMVLTSQPSANVTVTPNGGTQLASPAAVVFTNANWNLPQTVTVTATDDNVVEGTHSGNLTHTVSSADTNYAGLVVGQVTGSITDNDSAVVAFDPISVSQSEATSPMAFTVTLSNPVASGVTVTVNSTPGTATAADFTPIVAGTVSFAANSTASQTVNVVINNDALDEDNEVFTLTLSAPTATGNVTLGAAVATGTIQDDDLPPVISITSPSQLEGNAGNTPMNFVVSLSAVSGRDVSFTRATADGTATLADNDYVQLLPAGATILAGQSTLTIPVQIVGNATFEGNETFSLNLTGIVNATPTSLSGTGTIEDDDQQPTTTTITSDTPDPTVVGQPYAVAVTVAAQTTSPLGTVTISDGSATCGPVNLTTGTAPNSSATCNLTSTTAGAKTLVATYTAASTAFANSVSVGAPHQVNAAATAISVVGPVRSRINQPTAFTFALSVNAPGAGTPTGTVTLSSGASSCTATLPATSCNLTFNTLGARTVNASYAGDANFGGSTSSGAGNAQTLVFALSDIEVAKSDSVGTYVPGELLVYTVTVRNLGADAAANIRVRDQIPAGLADVVWSCDASGGVACPQAGGSGDLDATIGAFPVGALLNYTFYGNVAGSPAQIVNTALVELPADTTIEDPVPGNNNASDTNLLEFLFRNGFEDPLVNAPTGAYRLPSTGLREALNEVARVVFVLDDANGEALRVYARLFNGDVQYALAGRASNGLLRLTAWRSFASEPTLSWTATAGDRGWVLQGVDLR